MCNLNYVPQSDLRENFWVDNQLIVYSEDKFICKSNQIFAEKQTRRRVSTHRFHRNLSCAVQAYRTYWSSWFNRLGNKTTRPSVTSQTNERAEFWLIFSREDQQAAAKQDLRNNGLNYYLTLKEDINTWARIKQYLNSISPTIHCQQLRLSTDGDSIVA